MQKPTLGKLVRHLREQAGLSQEELAVHAQVSRATVQSIEGDRRAPRRAILRRVAEALGTDVVTLNQSLTAPDNPYTDADERALWELPGRFTDDERRELIERYREMRHAPRTARSVAD
jgi:transcriptional regulator with XRE-family HTH domain